MSEPAGSTVAQCMNDLDSFGAKHMSADSPHLYNTEYSLIEPGREQAVRNVSTRSTVRYTLQFALWWNPRATKAGDKFST